MSELYFTKSADLQGELDKILSRRLSPSFSIKRTDSGKPYLEGNPLFFSISHSKGNGVIAVCDRPVGVDLETITKRKFNSILSRFTQRERNEISDIREFLKHWVVREAYIKMTGATLAEKLKRLEYFQGVLYDGGKNVDCRLICGEREDTVYCVCIDNKSPIC